MRLRAVRDKQPRREVPQRSVFSLSDVARPFEDSPIRMSTHPDQLSSPMESIDFEALRRFLGDVPTLRGLLASPVMGAEDVALRAAMCRTMATLASVLDEAARHERTCGEAAMLRGTSFVAACLAACEPREKPGH